MSGTTIDLDTLIEPHAIASDIADRWTTWNNSRQQKIEEWKENDLLIYFLPPYSPELNLIEILWRRIKYQWLPFEAYLCFQNLKERLSSVLNNFGKLYDIKF